MQRDKKQQFKSFPPSRQWFFLTEESPYVSIYMDTKPLTEVGCFFLQSVIVFFFLYFANIWRTYVLVNLVLLII